MAKVLETAQEIIFHKADGSTHRAVEVWLNGKLVWQPPIIPLRFTKENLVITSDKTSSSIGLLTNSKWNVVEPIEDNILINPLNGYNSDKITISKKYPKARDTWNGSAEFINTNLPNASTVILPVQCDGIGNKISLYNSDAISSWNPTPFYVAGRSNCQILGYSFTKQSDNTPATNLTPINLRINSSIPAEFNTELPNDPGKYTDYHFDFNINITRPSGVDTEVYNIRIIDITGKIFAEFTLTKQVSTTGTTGLITPDSLF